VGEIIDTYRRKSVLDIFCGRCGSGIERQSRNRWDYLSHGGFEADYEEAESFRFLYLLPLVEKMLQVGGVVYRMYGGYGRGGVVFV
jgi:hypothetical protein